MADLNCGSCGSTTTVTCSVCGCGGFEDEFSKFIQTAAVCSSCKAQYHQYYACCGCGQMLKIPVKKGCVISSACVKAKGLPDDCAELETLRFWRDKLKKENERFKTSVDEYYMLAPEIVKRIDSDNNAKSIYGDLFENMVRKTVKLLQENKTDEAVEHYNSCYASLKEKYIG